MTMKMNEVIKESFIAFVNSIKKSLVNVIKQELVINFIIDST